MAKICPLFTIAGSFYWKGSNARPPEEDCKDEECMFFNNSQGICVISGQKKDDSFLRPAPPPDIWDLPEAEKTKVEHLAEVFGVEIGKPFNVRLRNGAMSKHNPYRLLSNGSLIDRDENKKMYIWADIILGEATVEEIPQEPHTAINATFAACEKWKPKEDDHYYYVGKHGTIQQCLWYYDAADCALWAIGGCFPTEKAAEAAKPEIMAKYEAIRREIEG